MIANASQPNFSHECCGTDAESVDSPRLRSATRDAPVSNEVRKRLNRLAWEYRPRGDEGPEAIRAADDVARRSDAR
jgi:hypothetical protein